MRTINHNVKVLRKHSGLSALKFAKKFGVNQGNIESYEQDRGTPSAEMCNKLCNFFSITMDQLTSQKLTPEDLIVTGRTESVIETRLNAALKEIELLGKTMAAKDEIIALQKELLASYRHQK